MKIRDVLHSWDFWASGILCVVAWTILPSQVLDKTAASFFNIATSILSILFSLFFAALSIMISSPADDFIKFLEREGLFTDLLSFFRFTLAALFLGLVLSIVGYSISTTVSDSTDEKGTQSFVWVAGYSFFFWYSLFSSLAAVLETLTFAKYRNRFLLNQKQAPKEVPAPISNQKKRSKGKKPR